MLEVNCSGYWCCNDISGNVVASKDVHEKLKVWLVGEHGIVLSSTGF